LPVFVFSLLFLGFFFDMKDFPALVMPAIGANRVRQAHLTAIAALHEIHALQRVIGAAAVSSTL
jgi:hypothetical protein